MRYQLASTGGWHTGRASTDEPSINRLRQLQLVMLHMHRLLASQQLKKKRHPPGGDRFDQAFKTVQAAVAQAHLDAGLEGADRTGISLVLLGLAGLNTLELDWF